MCAKKLKEGTFADMPVLKGSDLRKMTKADLEKKLEELRKELLDLRISKVVAGRVSDKLSRLSNAQKDVARVLTVINEKARHELRRKYEGMRHIPKDMRTKRTHAIRLELTHKQKSFKILKLHKRELSFPKRLYALKN